MTLRFSYKKALTALLVAGSTVACAPHGPPPVLGGPPPGITVNGSGEVRARPDVAKLRAGVQVRNASLDAATREANQKMTAILAALKQQGIADADLQTENFSVRFEHERPPHPPEQPRPMPAPMDAGPTPATAPGSASAPAPAPAPDTQSGPAGFFVVQNTAVATVRNLDTLGAVLSAALAAGANDVWGIQFDVDKPEGIQAQAREKAIADARTKAQSLATHAGVKLGKPVAIQDLGGGGRPMPAGLMMTKRYAEDAHVPVESGELTFTEQVQVVFSIAK